MYAESEDKTRCAAVVRKANVMGQQHSLRESHLAERDTPEIMPSEVTTLRGRDQCLFLIEDCFEKAKTSVK
ncbi:hypothetical protein HPB52_018227 [Rhipicephalus sanguineus]|uniref:Uncharacterized protein n=1 Tax=Rhipicephalus sanguineus TaxID=34632 RepID=A0A9D4STK8_RHISA|nr:hypothetical protein HPB52_018227 [Rhipicephalus sanguineus]